MSIKDFETSINASNGYVNSITKGIGSEKLKRIIEIYPNLDLRWLFKGDKPVNLLEDIEYNLENDIKKEDYTNNPKYLLSKIKDLEKNISLRDHEISIRDSEVAMLKIMLEEMKELKEESSRSRELIKNLYQDRIEGLTKRISVLMRTVEILEKSVVN